MLNLKELKKAYSGKKVLITGHNGFKGSYICLLLKFLGAKVYGYSLESVKGELYNIFTEEVKKCKGAHKILNEEHYVKSKNPTSEVEKRVEELFDNFILTDNIFNGKLIDGEVVGDIRDYKRLKNFVNKIKPDYILHMAAQPLVIRGYDEPRYTYEVNVMGTTNLLDAIRETYKNTKKLVSILNVTTDKVYENNDKKDCAFIESDKLCGRDPYANSKSCSELVTYAYEKSFFYDKSKFRISTARAGNVIGGGDLNANRIIPDCYRAIKCKKNMEVRNPNSIRPYQFVLEPLILYLNIMAYQMKDKKYEGNYNIGPDKKDCLNTKALTEKFYAAWDDYENYEVKNSYNIKKGFMPKVIYDKPKKSAVHEASFLRLDNKKVKKVFNYKEIFKIDVTMWNTALIYYKMLHKTYLIADIIKMIEKVY